MILNCELEDSWNTSEGYGIGERFDDDDECCECLEREHGDEHERS
jgi:hypothetical protein